MKKIYKKIILLILAFFLFGCNAENENIYRSATSATKNEVENFAKKVKIIILNNDCEALSKVMHYPIYINDLGEITIRESGKKIESESEFIEEIKNKKIAKSTVEAFEKEICENLLVSENDISIADRFVWFIDENFDKNKLETVGKPNFKIINISYVE